MTAQPTPRLASPSTASVAHSDAPRDTARDADTLPQAIEAEQQLLGAILLNNETYDRIAHIINPSHFHDPVHAHIFERIASRECACLLCLEHDHAICHCTLMAEAVAARAAMTLQHLKADP